MISLQRNPVHNIDNIMQSRGGFVWWYLDLVDAAGDGMVLVWSYGLPFLPGARRRPKAAERPSLSFAVYRQGKPHFYLLQELDAADAPCHLAASACAWRFNGSSIMWSEGPEGLRLTAELDLPIPASRERLQGRIDVHGARCCVASSSSPASAPGASTHAWTPLVTAARGHAELSWGAAPDEAVSLDGRAYLDHNASAAPLDGLGIDDWLWGRVGLGPRELIYYVVRPEQPQSQPVSMVLLVDPSGHARHVVAPVFEWRAPRRGAYGLSHHRELRISGPELNVTIHTRALVDDGPFYLRTLLEACDESGSTGRGFGERVVPKLVDLPWQRPFVRMRTHSVGGRNSIWLPLFSGKRSGRVSRLMSQLLPAGGSA